MPKVLVGASAVRDNLDRETLHIFSDNLAEPDRARACVQMYRVFLVREQPEMIRGRYAVRASPCRPSSSTAPPTPRCVPKMLAGWQRHADDMRVELVEGCGHFIADEAPDLVADRAIAFFSAST